MHEAMCLAGCVFLFHGKGWLKIQGFDLARKILMAGPNPVTWQKACKALRETSEYRVHTEEKLFFQVWSGQELLGLAGCETNVNVKAFKDLEGSCVAPGKPRMERVGLCITSGKSLLRLFTEALKYLLFLRMQCMSLQSVGVLAEPSTWS